MQSDKVNIRKIKKLDDYRIFQKEASKPIAFSSCLSDSNGDTFGSYGTLHSTTLFSPIAILRILLKKLNGTFIDLGCGIGIPLIYSVKHNWNAIGIEISKGALECCAINIKSAAKNKYISDKNYKLYNCSFFPKEFKITTSKKEGEDDFREELNKLSNKNKKNIDKSILQKGDLIYHYQVERRQNILNLFSEFGKKESLLVFVKTRNDEFKLPNNIIEIDSYNDIFIYKKI